MTAPFRFAFLGADGARARAYLDLMIAGDMVPSTVVLLGDDAPAPARPTDLFDATTTAATRAERAGARLVRLPGADVNAPRSCAEMARLEEDIVVFCGPPGALVRPPLFATGKRFLHAHPGRLPDFRGSTPMYYSLLAEGRLEVTALFLDASIDTGAIVGRATFAPPEDRSTLDHAFDPFMRASLLARVLTERARTGAFNEQAQTVEGETYFVIHPLLKHIAILAS